MTNGQNRSASPSAPKKAALVALLARYDVMLIEDDVYSELYFLPRSRCRRSSGINRI